MSAGSWPPTLPQIPAVGVGEESLPNFIESEVDQGPPKRRRRTSKGRKIQTVSLELTGAEYALLMTFYEDTLLDGSLTFDWTDAINDTATEFRFVNPPKITQWTAAPDPDDRIYNITLELEVM